MVSKTCKGDRLGKWPRPHGNGSWRGRRTCTSGMEPAEDFRPPDPSSWSTHSSLKAYGLCNRRFIQKENPRQNLFKAKPISYISAGQCLSLAWECLNFWSTLVFSITKLYPSILFGKSLLLKLKLNKRVHYPDYNTSLQKSRGKRLHVWKNCFGSRYVSGLNLYLFCKGKILILYCKKS